MEHWINRLLMGCGSGAGLLLGTGHIGEGIALAVATIAAVWLMRMRARVPASEEF